MYVDLKFKLSVYFIIERHIRFSTRVHFAILVKSEHQIEKASARYIIRVALKQ